MSDIKFTLRQCSCLFIEFLSIFYYWSRLGSVIGNIVAQFVLVSRYRVALPWGPDPRRDIVDMAGSTRCIADGCGGSGGQI